ncbi:hypothetical protein, partial [Ilumatobacter sp.]|uniref:hypothetical protein n=1 Tax=Ilumatobacter sp. TaxID=1967498 RepID=UPI003AF9AD64
MLSLLRARIGLVTAMMLVVAIAAGDIFDRRVWWFLVPPALAGTGALITMSRRWPARFGGAVLAVAGGTVVVVTADGTSSDLGAAFGAGTPRLIS